MISYMGEITAEMVETVDKLKRTNFEGATPDEMALYTEYVRLNALQDAEFKDTQARREQRAKERREANQRKTDAAVNALEALADLARAKLKAVENGQV